MQCTLGGSEKLLFSGDIATYYRKFHITRAYRPGVVTYFCLRVSRGSYETTEVLEVCTCGIYHFRSVPCGILCCFELVISTVLGTEECRTVLIYASSSLLQTITHVQRDLRK
jgi:hypothetical protein